VNYELIAQQILTRLRGERSQLQWSRRLGYRSNVAYPWESGRRSPTAAEMLRAARLSGIDVQDAVRRFYGEVDPDWLDRLSVDTAEGVAALLDDLRGKVSISEVARRIRTSRTAVSRWLSGTAQPKLPDFLRLLEAVSLRMVDFVATLVDPRQLPSLRRIWRQLETRRQGAVEHPWTPAILRGLELDAYRALPAHRPGWLARELGISREEEERCIAYLEAAGLIRWSGTHYRAPSLTVDTRGGSEVGRRHRQHWSRVAADRIGDQEPGQYSYNVFCVSREDFERIRALHLQYFRSLRSIAAVSAPNEVVAVANVQLFPLAG